MPEVTDTCDAYRAANRQRMDAMRAHVLIRAFEGSAVFFDMKYQTYFINENDSHGDGLGF